MPSQFPCAVTCVAVIDKENHYLISAAYMAFASGKKSTYTLRRTCLLGMVFVKSHFLDVIN